MSQLMIVMCGACVEGEVVDGVCRQCGVAGDPVSAPRVELPLLTASRMRCFRSCPRLHQLRYVEGWRPTAEAEALRFGTLTHLGLEAWWRAAGGAPVELCATCVTFVDTREPIDAALCAVHGRAYDPYEQVRLDELLIGYDARWRSAAAEYEVIGVELEYRAPQINPGTMKTGRTWELGGKIDAIARRKSDGHVLVVEHKTTSEVIDSDEDHYWQTLALDQQISGYVIGAEALGHQVDEVLYDVIRKVGQKPLKATPIENWKYRERRAGRAYQPPEPFKSGPRKGEMKPAVEAIEDETAWAWNDARLLYANIRTADETPDEYRERVRASIAVDLPRFFQRRSIARTESQIRNYLQNAWQLGRAMREMELDGHAPQNPAACHQYGTCEMWLVCSTESSPESFPAEYRRVGNVNPELNGGM